MTLSLVQRRILGVVAAIAVAMASALLPGGRVTATNSRSSLSQLVTGGGAGLAAQKAQSYIVAYANGVRDVRGKTDRLEASIGFQASHRFSHALNGFAARLSPQQLQRVKGDPDVLVVSEDRPVKALDVSPLSSGEPTPPTGVRRIEAATATTTRTASGVNVAVIDTGVDLTHPDLNAAQGKNCLTSGASANDDNGHGSHVAGTIGAKNNGSGVVGVAPGTKIYAVKVLDYNGNGSWSDVICGIDWVAATRTDTSSTNDIAVANMSLGGTGGDAPTSCSSDSLHLAICNATNAGVTFVVAAGNSGCDFDNIGCDAQYPGVDTPAAYPEVLTVTAVSDSDGMGAANGGNTTCGWKLADDNYASFSNYAVKTASRSHMVAAPGVCIRSTWMNGGYNTISGTSMASPHIAGAVALCIAEGSVPGPCGGQSPAQIINTMVTTAQDHSVATPTYGFTGDPSHPVSGRYYGYMAWAGTPAPAPAPAPDVTSPTVSSVLPADGASGVGTSAKVSVTFSEPMDHTSAEDAFSLMNAGDNTAVAGAFSWSGNTMTFQPSAPLAGGTTYGATVTTAATDSAGNPLDAEKTWSFVTLATVTNAPSGTTIQSGSAKAGSSANLGADDNVYFQVNSTTSSTYRAYWYATVTDVSNSLKSLSVTYRGKNSASATQIVSIYNWTKGSWVQLDSRSVGTSEVLVQKSPVGTLADYVGGSSGSGEVRVRIRASRKSGRFYSSGDLLTVSFTA